MEDGDRDALSMKIVVIGGPNVGKTSIIGFYVSNHALSATKPTVQLAFSKKVEDVGGRKVCLHICDTAGQEKFQSVCPNFYRDSDAAMIVFDVTSRESFNKVPHWLDELNAIMGAEFTKMVIGNKVDLEAERVVSTDEAIEFCDAAGLHYLETSALTGDGIAGAFVELCETFMKVHGHKDQEVIPEKIALKNPSGKSQKQCC